MKRIFVLLFVFVLFQCSLAFFCVDYDNIEGVYSFQQICAADMSDKIYTNDNTPDYRGLNFIDPELEKILIKCDFESIDFIQAIKVYASSGNSKQVSMGFVNSKMSEFNGKEYMMGWVNVFPDKQSYLTVMYYQEDLKLSATGWTCTTYKIIPSEEIENRISEFSENTEEKTLLQKIVGFIGFGYYSIVTQQPVVLFIDILFLLVFISMCVINKIRRKNYRQNGDIVN